MNVNEVYILIEKYFDGNTSLEEEQKLRDFFSDSVVDLPDDLKAYKALFKREIQKEIPVLDVAFTEDTWNKINKNASGKTSNKTPQNEARTKVFSINAFRWILATAASFILILSVYQWYNIKQYEQFIAVHNQKEMTKQEALLATKQALAFVSVKLNEGRRPMKNVGSFYRFQNVIKKSKNENISKDIRN